MDYLIEKMVLLKFTLMEHKFGIKMENYIAKMVRQLSILMEKKNGG